jgi:predicted membrane GTPase involved in stress response
MNFREHQPAGRVSKFVTSRQIWDRLQKELQHNVALRVKKPTKKASSKSWDAANCT